MKPYALAAGAAVAILLTSCGSSSNTTDTAATTSAAAPTTSSAAAAPQAAGGIIIKDFKYSGTLTVKPGEKVSVTNMDAKPHTVTDKGGKFDSGNIAENGGTGTFTAPTAPGSYQVICKYHPRMAATLIVKA
jgi:plastocyanin